MNKKIITIGVTFVLFSSLLTPIAFASEISGTLSSDGSLTQGQSTSGTLTGSVVGGNSGGISVVSYGGGGGGCRAPVVATVDSTNQPFVNSNSSDAGGVSSDGSATILASGPAGDPSVNENVSTSATDSDTGVVATSEQIIQADPVVSTSEIGSVLGAQAGESMPISNEIAWILFAVLLIIIMGIGYVYYRKHDKNNKKVVHDKSSN